MEAAEDQGAAQDRQGGESRGGRRGEPGAAEQGLFEGMEGLGASQEGGKGRGFGGFAGRKGYPRTKGGQPQRR